MGSFLSEFPPPERGRIKEGVDFRVLGAKDARTPINDPLLTSPFQGEESKQWVSSGIDTMFVICSYRG
jgi:hypothetical protein